MIKIAFKAAVILTLLLTSIFNRVSAQEDASKTETFKVSGNCEMCKKTIEGSLKMKKGVINNSWNTKTKMLTVTYIPAAISLSEIKQAIAAKGYDTDNVRASDEAYNNLHKCCQYERTK